MYFTMLDLLRCHQHVYGSMRPVYGSSQVCRPASLRLNASGTSTQRTQECEEHPCCPEVYKTLTHDSLPAMISVSLDICTKCQQLLVVHVRYFFYRTVTGMIEVSS
jgi:hypothetical protein